MRAPSLSLPRKRGRGRWSRFVGACDADVPYSRSLMRFGGGMNSARIAALCSPSAGTAP
jgi:hypothetical protein